MIRSVSLSAPHPLRGDDDLAGFDCGKPALNRWLRSRARANQHADYTQVIVVTNELSVVGYYGLSLSSVHRGDAPRRVSQHPASREIPCLLLGQLAVDVRWKGHGIGTGLLRDALIRALTVAEHVGTRAVVVNALDSDAAAFWKHAGFIAVAKNPSSWFRTIADIRATLDHIIRE